MLAQLLSPCGVCARDVRGKAGAEPSHVSYLQQQAACHRAPGPGACLPPPAAAWLHQSLRCSRCRGQTAPCSEHPSQYSLAGQLMGLKPWLQPL